jgi:hypothetical protein
MALAGKDRETLLPRLCLTDQRHMRRPNRGPSSTFIPQGVRPRQVEPGLSAFDDARGVIRAAPGAQTQELS